LRLHPEWNKGSRKHMSGDYINQSMLHEDNNFCIDHLELKTVWTKGANAFKNLVVDLGIDCNNLSFRQEGLWFKELLSTNDIRSNYSCSILCPLDSQFFNKKSSTDDCSDTIIISIDSDQSDDEKSEDPVVEYVFEESESESSTSLSSWLAIDGKRLHKSTKLECCSNKIKMGV
jgi:hypothetical protein